MKQETRDAQFFWLLFKSTFLISAFTVGGGFVIIPLLKDKFVDTYHWLTDKDALEMVSLAQAAPGAVAVNAAIIMGYRLAGLAGALCALVATILPPLLIITVIAFGYDFFAHNPMVQAVLRGMQCGATALILVVMVRLLRKELQKKQLLITAIIVGTFVANYCFKVNIMYAVVVDAFIGYLCMQDKRYE